MTTKSWSGTSSLLGLAASFWVLLLAPPSVHAQCWEAQLPWPSQAGAEMGASVATALNVVVAGAPQADQPGLGAVGDVTVSRNLGGTWTSTWATSGSTPTAPGP